MEITEDRINDIFDKKKLSREDITFVRDYAKAVGYNDKKRIKRTLDESNELSQAIRTVLGYKIDDIVMVTPLTTVETVGILDTARWKLLHAVTNVAMGDLIADMSGMPPGTEVVPEKPQEHTYFG